MNNESYKNKYRVKSARLENYDYSLDGLYFITICTKDREFYFGDVKNNEMILNNIGQMAEKYWQEIPVHFNNVLLDEFIVMPNHLHGIIIINNNVYVEMAGKIVHMGKAAFVGNDAHDGDDAFVDNKMFVGRDEACLVSTDVLNGTNMVKRKQTLQNRADRDKTPNFISQKMQKISPKPKSLPVIIGSYKSTVTRELKIIHPNFTWQSRYYDHIIRNEKSLNKIRLYIIDNPEKWEADRNNIENIWM